MFGLDLPRKFKPNKMKNYFKLLLPTFLLLTCFSCDKIDDFLGDGGTDDDQPTDDTSVATSVDFSFVNTFDVDGEDSAEISAYDPATKRLFVTNGALDEITVFDISDVNSPSRTAQILVHQIALPSAMASLLWQLLQKMNRTMVLWSFLTPLL